MDVRIYPTRDAMSRAAAEHAAAALQRIVAARGHATVVAATAASQLEFQRALAALPDVPWRHVEIFQLDEYIGLPHDHPAAFRQLLVGNVVRPTGVATVHLIDGMDAEHSRAELNALLSAADVDLAWLGIGENAHLAFNDPPADFSTPDPYIVVSLDEACRRQQVSEGWFAAIDDVPATAVSMSIRQMLRAHEILVVVPDARKAAAVKATLEGEISPDVPASILRTHPNVTLYLDDAAARALEPATRARRVSS
ncbi:MAG: 6-phosphogluconolactonase [Acidobacteria bacterium]|nr:6-phosphogluconolactonase [Acidobacteriota bacterium]